MDSYANVYMHLFIHLDSYVSFIYSTSNFKEYIYLSSISKV